MKAKLYDARGIRVLAEVSMHSTAVDLVIWPGKFISEGHPGNYESRFFIRDRDLGTVAGDDYIVGYRESAVTASVNPDKGKLPA
jgi:hypothetical protein